MATRGRCVDVLMSAFILVAILAMAAPAPAAAQEIHAFNVFSTDPASAIRAFGAQADIQILASADDLKGKRFNPVIAEVSTEQGLTDLLAGTGLDHRYVGDRAVALVRNSSGQVADVQSPTDADLQVSESQTSSQAPASIAQNVDEGSSKISGEKNQATDNKAASPEPTPAEIEEIVVTAQRRAENLDKVPISVTAFSQRSMDDLQIENLADLATIVPGLYVAPVLGANQDATSIAIRGILTGNNAPTTQIYIDETPIGIRQLLGAGPSGSPQPQIFDLDRVEVLRGPQGTLFGASAMGGALRFITPQPSLSDSTGFTKADLSNTDRGGVNYEIGAAYGAPIVTGVAGFRVSAWFRSDSGFIDQENPYTGQLTNKDINASDSYVIRPAVTWAPSDDLTLTPSLYLQHKHSPNPNSYWLSDLPQPEFDGHHVWGGLAQPLTDDLRVASLAIKFTFGSLSLQSDTSYLDRELTESSDFTNFSQYIFSGNSFIPGVPQSFHSEWTDNSFTHAWQQEFRLSSNEPASWLSWVAGAYFRRAVEGLEQIIPPDLSPVTYAIAGENSLAFFGVPDYPYNGQQLNSYTNFHTTDLSEAIFGDLTTNFSQRVKADLGVRVEREVVEHQNEILAGPLNGAAYLNTNVPDQHGTPVTPRASLTYQYTDNDMIYISAAKGFRPGGGNAATAVGNSLCDPSLKALGLSTVPTTFQSDSLWSYEIGTKGTAFDRRLSIEGSAYYIRWSNIQNQVALPSCAEGFTTNQGRAISQGFDLQFAAILAEELKLHGYVGYTDTYYPEAAYGAPINGVVPLLNGAGDKLAQIRPWTAALNADYSRDFSALWTDSRTYLRLDYRWSSAANSLNPSVANYDPQTGPHQDPAYGILNIRLGITHGGLDLSAYLDNTTNADPVLAYFNWGAGDTLLRATQIPPRRVGITAWFRF